MTGSLRSTARNPVAVALMGLLMLVFLLLGVSGGGRFADIFRTGGGDAVVAAGAHEMGSRDFRRVFDAEKNRFEQQSGQDVPTEILVQNGFDQQLLNAIAQDEAESEMLARAGIDPAPALVDAEIRKMPIAFDRVTGRFSESQFTEALAAQGLTVRQVEAELGDDVAERQFTVALEAGLAVPLTYAALAAVQGLENRDVSFFVLDPRTLPAPPAPTDAQLMAFMQEHAAQLTRPELRTFSLVRFSAAALAPTIVIDPATVEKAFEARKASLSTPETRTIVEIAAKTPGEAAAAAKRLAAGEDPRAIAAGFGAEPILWTDKSQAAITDRKLAAAAFSMQPGQVEGPVQGDIGPVAIKLVKITAPVVATLENSRGKIEADLRGDAAKNRAYDLSQKFDDAVQAGASVAAAAAKVGVAPITLGPLTAQGVGLDGKPSPLVNEKILKTAFSQSAGEDSDLEDAGPGDYFALHVDKVTPPSLPPIAQFRPQLVTAWTQERQVAVLKAKADDLIAKVRKGASMESAAAAAGAHLTHQIGMTRAGVQQHKAMGRDFLQAVFGAKAGEVFAAAVPSGQVLVAKLDAIRPGDLAAMAAASQQVRPRMTQDYAQDLVEAVKSASRAKVGATVNLSLARQAIGVDPNAVRKAGAAPGPGAGKAK